MSVARAKEVVARLRAAGITVHEAPNAYSRGNGQSSAYEGFIWHHTATGFSNSNISVLINGRSDLSGPLCNTCGWANGDIGLIAAHPANHAGASGGYGTSPLPKTSSFNKTVWGHEIIYPGNQPMTDAQYRSALILAKICVDVFGYGDINRAKGHRETSVTGKWDPGYAPGKTYDLSKMRSEAAKGQTTPVVPEAPREEEEMGYGQSYEFKDNNWHTFTFPFQVSGSSTNVKRGWLSLDASWGNVEYELWITDGKKFLNLPEGEPTKGILQKDKPIAVRLPENTWSIKIQFKSKYEWPTPDPNNPTDYPPPPSFGAHVWGDQIK